MFFKITSVLLCSMMIQAITGQCVRNPYPAAPYTDEINAANLAAEAALANGAYPGYGQAAPSGQAYPPYEYEAPAGPGVPGLTYGLSLADLAASNGGGMQVNSVSPMSSTGVTVESENMVIEGPLAVTGQLPFLGVVALEGPLPATGTGAVAYECGNGHVGIISEGIEPVVPVYPNAVLTPAYPNVPIGPAYPIATGYPDAGVAAPVGTYGPVY